MLSRIKFLIGLAMSIAIAAAVWLTAPLWLGDVLARFYATSSALAVAAVLIFYFTARRLRAAGHGWGWSLFWFMPLVAIAAGEALFWTAYLQQQGAAIMLAFVREQVLGAADVLSVAGGAVSVALFLLVFLKTMVDKRRPRFVG
ncbi:MAG: hypothetical protein ACFCUN_01660 [Hyphomicrobiaceae bacterium]